MSSELKEEMSTMMSRMIEEHEVKLSSTLEAIMSRFLLSAKADMVAAHKTEEPAPVPSVLPPVTKVVPSVMMTSKPRYSLAEKQLSVPELTKTSNWTSWSTRFMTLMKAEKLDFFFAPTYKEADQLRLMGAENLAYAKLVAVGVLVTKVDAELLQVVREASDPDDPVEVYRRLRENFQGSTEYNVMSLNKALLSLNMNKSSSMSLSAFIDTLNSLCHRLADGKVMIPDSQKKAILLDGLHERYREFANMMMMIGMGLTYDQVCVQIRTYHQNRFDLSPLENPGDSAHKSGKPAAFMMTASTSNPQEKKGGGEKKSGNETVQSKSESGGKNSRRFPCKNCGQRGHHSRDCQNPTKCFNCNGNGHTSLNCTNPKQPRGANGGKAGQPQQNRRGKQKNEASLIEILDENDSDPGLPIVCMVEAADLDGEQEFKASPDEGGHCDEGDEMRCQAACMISETPYQCEKYVDSCANVTCKRTTEGLTNVRYGDFEPLLWRQQAKAKLCGSPQWEPWNRTEKCGSFQRCERICCCPFHSLIWTKAGSLSSREGASRSRTRAEL